ncbi:MAG: ABC transporter ATP-binding protein [Alphaproteobacteria bacterium]|jgi:lipoprotein-releasing system ATP-binding protein|nr:ABC transporter [Rhodobiaceae bacterium]MBO6542019.1 ABC transporter ATP-binding protein [Alphaproteobacteria bacterium]MBO6628188.1 ABC transporter ATP-binding protein [Alphaproteobacteria bacterium]MDF1625125.1 ABC transporter ATP-binding protein [Parvibaculaceae bacterium]
MNNRGHEVLRLEQVTRVYHQGEMELQVFKDLTLSVSAGEIVALVGPSGSGKSSLLHIAGLLEAPDSGTILVNNIDCGTLEDKGRTAVRRTDIGFVYQAHNLLPEFTALENVILPQIINGKDKKAAALEAERLLSSFGLGARLTHRPAELSGGEQQRVAIARALANKPSLLLADEPTGNLDPKTSKAVFSEMVEVTKREGAAAFIATHNLDLAAKMDRVVLLHDGKLIEGSSLAADYKSL